MPPPPASTMRRDVISAYGLTIARILSWVVVSGAVYRICGADDFAVVALVRATVGLLSYVSLGIGPAIVRMLSVAQSTPRLVQPLSADETQTVGGEASVLSYASHHREPPPNQRIVAVYITGETVALMTGFAGLLLASIYSASFRFLHELTKSEENYVGVLVLAFGVGIVLRVISDAPSALLQVRGKIALDNIFAIGAEVCWMALSILWLSDSQGSAVTVGVAFLVSNALLLGARAIAGRLEVRSLTSKLSRYDRHIRNALLSYGSLVTVAQLADFLYSPVDFILINRLINPVAVAVYAPAVHIDGGLLVLVTGLAAVLLPKAAMAHASGDVARVRSYYLRGTLATAAMLVIGAIAVWALSPWIFRLWLGDEMKATQAILPLILIHTVVGGSSAVGRAILIGMGKAKAFTISVIAAGLANVVLSIVFVRFFDLGLQGIVLGTIVVVVARAGLWMPWYVWRSLRHAETPIEVVRPGPEPEIP